MIQLEENLTIYSLIHRAIENYNATVCMNEKVILMTFIKTLMILGGNFNTRLGSNDETLSTKFGSLPVGTFPMPL